MRPHPQVLIESAVQEYGEAEVIDWTVSLLSGQVVQEHLDIGLLGGSTGWAPYWSRVWGARAFLYVWNESAAPSVIGGLSDEHWRVREMCAKVCRHRELTQGSAALVELATDGNERVRLSALRAIGDICEADSAGPLLAKQFPRAPGGSLTAATNASISDQLVRTTTNSKPPPLVSSHSSWNAV